jgi:ABC-2 type transport system permease protein
MALHRRANRPRDSCVRSASSAIQSTRNLTAEHIGPWAGLGVLSLYAAGAVIAGLIVFNIRDAR